MPGKLQVLCPVSPRPGSSPLPPPNMHICQGQFHWHNAQFPKPAKTSDGVLQRDFHLGGFGEIQAKLVHVFRRGFFETGGCPFQSGDVLTPLTSEHSPAQALPTAALLVLAVGTACTEQILDPGWGQPGACQDPGDISACAAHGACTSTAQVSFVADMELLLHSGRRDHPNHTIHPCPGPPAPRTDTCVFFNTVINCVYISPLQEFCSEHRGCPSKYRFSPCVG